MRTILKHVIARIRRHWPKVRILVRGDSHYGRVEAMEWCEEHGMDYIFGFGGNAVLKAMIRQAADVLCVERAARAAAKLRSFATLSYGAKGWNKERCIVARIEATANGLDIRYVVTSLKGTAKHLYETVYCGRGQAENFIKLHKAQLASDRTSCRDPRANQFRLILHTAAYWLMLTARNADRKALAARGCGVRDAALSADQDRRPRDRRSGPHSCPLAHRMSRSCRLPPTRRAALRSRTVSDATVAASRPPSQPPTRKNTIATRRVDTIRRDPDAVPSRQKSPRRRATNVCSMNRTG